MTRAMLLAILLAGVRVRTHEPLPRAATGEPGAAAACADVGRVWVAVQRVSAPDAALPAGTCAAPDLLPFRLEALVLDTSGEPIAGCDATFDVLPFPGPCGQTFGRLCGAATATTDARGIAVVEYEMTQADADMCNCLPSGSKCQPLCATACSAACSPAGDYFCAVVVAARAGGVESGNVQFLEYGR